MAERNFGAAHRYKNYRVADERTYPESETQPEPEETPQISMKNTETKSGAVLSIVLVSVLAAILLGIVIYSLDKRSTMYSEVAALNNELTLVQAENVRLQAALEGEISAKNVEDYAENVLGMQKIDSSQIKYIEIQTDDVVNIPEQDEGIIDKIGNFFEGCVEYFRG
ncbi:MAG: hypothetical protein J6K77_02895 [Ruminococcus sp.]|nr:hypothetical protein [Ruminococcus sp.]